MSNIFDDAGIDKFLLRTRQDLNLGLTEQLEIFIEPKIDGLSFSAVYKNGELVLGSTRGNGIEGENITENLKNIDGLPKLLNNSIYPPPRIMEIRGEVFINKNLI